jgi:hypothetical protein
LSRRSGLNAPATGKAAALHYRVSPSVWNSSVYLVAVRCGSPVKRSHTEVVPQLANIPPPFPVS